MEQLIVFCALGGLLLFASGVLVGTCLNSFSRIKPGDIVAYKLDPEKYPMIAEVRDRTRKVWICSFINADGQIEEPVFHESTLVLLESQK